MTGADADWKEIEQFCRRLDVLYFHGSPAKCRKIAALRLHDSLENLLTCLFFEQRRWSQCEMMGMSPGEVDLSYMRKLVDKIREMVGADPTHERRGCDHEGKGRGTVILRGHVSL